MKLCVLLPLLVTSLFTPTSAVSRQARKPSQATAVSVAKSPMWTEADKRQLLAKAQRRDADAQSWLGAAYAQGWFGQADFQDGLKGLRKAAKSGNPDAQNELGQMYEDAEGVPQNYAQAASGMEQLRNTSRTSAVVVREEIT